MAALRILFISPYLPSQIRVRPYNLIKYLAEQGHELTLLAMDPPGEDTGGLEKLRRWCREVQTIPLSRWQIMQNGLQALPTATPFQAAYARSPEMTRLIQQTLARGSFDVVHIEHLRGAELGSAVTGVPVVFDSVDSISLLFERVLAAGPNWRKRFLARLDLARTRRYEGHLLERFSRVLITSPQDKAALVRLSTTPAAQDRLVVLPNGVDLDYFGPMAVPRDPATLIFSGKMSYHANIAAALDLVHEVMPLIWQQLPATRLVIAGKDPTPQLLALTQDPRITVTGTVPDLRPYLAQATVALAPMRYGVGIQNKVLEAMAMATPVISTPQALSALQVQSGQEAIAADTPQHMAQAVVKLLTNAPLRQRIGETGRRYVETCHDWQAIVKKLERVYREVMAVKTPALPYK